ncbi:putative integral membrane protein [Lasiodiplodia theobromae]|uniref:Integral membrane protein n=1 Tax=Lasiodiplodia theobromae TaxID=45133 RepID=A0A5N5DID7_9PEZI|nr:Integral membrane protein [Lasiodiplodia theobromae]KAB2577081.1 hypothetical protein DBV05_g4251 [Lasiodiplodia theobromae]KAF4543742.1 Integral membrane protein [Lasiodiplodia theobromae]KAF9631480.1 putative integral membrane protein [Lasiodiplodia theobromae]
MASPPSPSTPARRMSRFSEDFSTAVTFGKPQRCRHFQPQREPLAHRSDLRPIEHKINGPLNGLNPTRAHYNIVGEGGKSVHADSSHGVSWKWTSRNNRKGRHALQVQPISSPAVQHELPRKTTHPTQILRGVGRMLTRFPVWDISYLVAVIFTLGSAIWVLNAFFVLLPLVRPSSEFQNEVLYGGGVTAFIGATVFVVGSVLLLLEAVNDDRAGCFGWAVERLFQEDAQPNAEKADEECLVVRVHPKSPCDHHHSNRKILVESATHPGGPRKWQWAPSWKDLRTHYFRELGFLASLIQLVSATVFWIAGFTSLPGIYDHMSTGLRDGVYWTPQILGGLGFILSGTLFMVETQVTWWKPAPSVLGWHIGFWNLIGGIGFTLCPAFGYDPSSWAQYQAACSTFWGSWAFLIGSIIQWYESLDKYPVEYKDHDEE